MSITGPGSRSMSGEGRPRGMSRSTTSVAGDGVSTGAGNGFARELSPRPDGSGSTHSFYDNNHNHSNHASPGVYEDGPPAFFTDEPAATSSSASGMMSPGSSKETSGTATPRRQPSTAPSSSLPYLEGDLTTSKEMWIIPLATQDKGALSLDVRRRTLAPGLGLVDWGLASNAVCVGGLAKFWIRIKDINPGATIWSVRLSINQTFALRSPRRPEEEETVFPSSDILMYKLGSLPRNQEERYVLPNNRAGLTHRPNKGDKSKDPLWEGELVPRPDATVPPVDELEISETVRMPDENRLRPSTCPG